MLKESANQKVTKFQAFQVLSSGTTGSKSFEIRKVGSIDPGGVRTWNREIGGISFASGYLERLIDAGLTSRKAIALENILGEFGKEEER